MTEQERPNPEELLEAVTREDKRAHRGKLKIFLGMAAGVGKTYSMLEDAHIMVTEGVNVVVGIVVTHGRPETAALLEGLPVIPPKKIVYKDHTFEELDLEAILALKPELVLVDELAHSNIPGATHLKRWQDVEVILEQGINVSTTLNVQHIESLKDIVETITGVVIRESVPDSIVERAASIELVDLTPEELLVRLQEGKVYLGSQANVAQEHFFQDDRLAALRELTLRFAAEKVDHDLRGMVASVERRAGWRTRERLLVAVSHSPHSKKLIRTARRLSFVLDADWVAVHVDDGTELNPEELEMLEKNLALARELGAELITTQDPDYTSAIERIARQKQVTQIIIGRPTRRGIFGYFQKFRLLDRLATECTDIDVHVIAQTPSLVTDLASHKKKKKLTLGSSGAAYLLSICSVLAFASINYFIEPYVGYKIVGFLFFLGILASSLIFKKGPVVLGALLYGIIWDYYFIPPVETLMILKGEDTFFLVLYVLTGVVTGILSDRARQHNEMLIKREKTSETLYEIVREIASTPTSEGIVKSVTRRLNAALPGRASLLIRTVDNGLNVEAHYGLISNAKERAAVLWVFENGKEAGASTSTLPALLNFYIPLKGYKEMIGVLAYRPQGVSAPSIDEKNLLYAAGQQLAYYLERHMKEEMARNEELLKQIDLVYRAVRRASG